MCNNNNKTITIGILTAHALPCLRPCLKISISETLTTPSILNQTNKMKIMINNNINRHPDSLRPPRPQTSPPKSTTQKNTKT